MSDDPRRYGMASVGKIAEFWSEAWGKPLSSNQCWVCGVDCDPCDRAHITAAAIGGGVDASNLFLTCRFCNNFVDGVTARSGRDKCVEWVKGCAITGEFSLPPVDGLLRDIWNVAHESGCADLMHVNGAAVQAYRILSALKQSKVQAGVMKARAKRDAGRYTGGRVRYGYRLDDAGALVEDPAEQLAIKGLLELRAGGLSLRAVARELEARGLMARGGKRWAAQTVKQIESDNEVTP